MQVFKKARVLNEAGNFLFIVPALVFFCMFTIYPLFMTFYLGFFKWDGLTSNMSFIGLENFKEAFSDKGFWQSMLNSVYYAALAILLMNPLALVLAVFVHSGVKLSRFYRVVYYIPPLMSALVVGYIWSWMYEPYNGIINSTLTLLGLSSLKQVWLTNMATVIPAVSIASIWQGFGGSFILFWAGLEGINPELYEAAQIDGANNRQQLTKITMPLLSKVYTVITILTVLGVTGMFPLIMGMTKGGPGYASTVPTVQIYNTAFKWLRYGYASALSLIVGITMLIFSYIRMKLSRDDD